jgi:hypothetical protein
MLPPILATPPSRFHDIAASSRLFRFRHAIFAILRRHFSAASLIFASDISLSFGFRLPFSIAYAIIFATHAAIHYARLRRRFFITIDAAFRHFLAAAAATLR